MFNAALFVVVLMSRAAWSLLRDSGHVLLEGAPANVDLRELRTHLMETSYVVAVHDLHAWTSGSRLPSVSAHVVVDDACFADGRSPQLLDELQGCLAGHFRNGYGLSCQATWDGLPHHAYCHKSQYCH